MKEIEDTKGKEGNKIMLEGVKNRGRGTDGEDEVNEKSNVKGGPRNRKTHYEKHIAMWTI